MSPVPKNQSPQSVKTRGIELINLYYFGFDECRYISLVLGFGNLTQKKDY
jgi:hypothetical protein